MLQIVAHVKQSGACLRLPLTAGLVPRPALHDWTAQYTNMGLLTNMDVDLDIGGSVAIREHTATYDELGLTTTGQVRSNESGSWVTRDFTYDRDLATGEYTRVGPDGVETFVQLDTANRVQLYRRGPPGDPVMTAVYTYHADDRVESATNGNGSSIWYTYDAARRVTQIEHRALLGQMFCRLEYTYDGRDLPLTLTESDAVGWTATVLFSYNARDRLTGVGAPSFATAKGGGRIDPVWILVRCQVDA